MSASPTSPLAPERGGWLDRTAAGGVHMGVLATITLREEQRMRRFPRLAPPVLLALALAALTGCAGGPSTTSAVPVAIQDIKTVAGKWAGVYSRDTSSTSQEDWVRLAIDDNGTYEFASARQVGVLHGRGKLAVRDGKLYGLSERGGTVVASLFDRGGKPLLKVAAQDAAGLGYTAELTRGQ
jgi:hypothetical protein